MPELIHISPHVSLTGAKADRWIQIKPGTEGLVALAIAHFIRDKFAIKETYFSNFVFNKGKLSNEAIKDKAGDDAANHARDWRREGDQRSKPGVIKKKKRTALKCAPTCPIRF